VAKLGIKPTSLGADKAYGSGEFLAWMLAHGVEPHIPVIDHRHQTDGHFTRDQFVYDPVKNAYECPREKYWHIVVCTVANKSTFIRPAKRIAEDVRKSNNALLPLRADCRLTGVNQREKRYAL
jgi:hypothetical protein